MTIEQIRAFCKSLQVVTEGIKWKKDLCFMVGGKMFCVVCLEPPLTVSFKVKEAEFDQLTCSPGIIPAPYVARYHWVMVTEVKRLSPGQWKHFLKQSYDLVKARLPKK